MGTAAGGSLGNYGELSAKRRPLGLSSTLPNYGHEAALRASRYAESSRQHQSRLFNQLLECPQELGSRGITVNAVSPGFIDTVRGGPSSVVDPAHRADRRVPMGHLGVPDDVASLCCYLASDQARFITGQVFAVNGGTYV